MASSNDSLESTVIGPRVENYELNTPNKVEVECEDQEKVGLQQAVVLGKLPKFRPFKGLRRLVSNSTGYGSKKEGNSGNAIKKERISGQVPLNLERRSTLNSDMDDTAYTPTDTYPSGAYTPSETVAYTPTDTVASNWDTETVTSRHNSVNYQSRANTPLQRARSLQNQNSISAQKRAERLRGRLTPSNSDIYPERPGSSRSNRSCKSVQYLVPSKSDVYRERRRSCLVERDINGISNMVLERSNSVISLRKLDENAECVENSLQTTPRTEKGSSSPFYGTLFSLINLNDVRDYVSQPVCKGTTVLCYIVRQKGRNGGSSTYSLYLDEGGQLLLTATKKRKGVKIYVHDSEQKEKRTTFAKLKQRLGGYDFTLCLSVDPTSSECRAAQELAHVQFCEDNGLRQMTTILPKVDCISSERTVFVPQNENQSCLAKVYHGDGKQQQDNEILILHNKPPTYNQLLQAHQLNFNGRVIHASVKNFQLVSDQDTDYVVLQFGKIGTDIFTMDVQWPMSPLQGFGICLSSFGVC